jgi:hypothetical protein
MYSVSLFADSKLWFPPLFDIYLRLKSSQRFNQGFCEHVVLAVWESTNQWAQTDTKVHTVDSNPCPERYCHRAIRQLNHRSPPSRTRQDYSVKAVY